MTLEKKILPPLLQGFEPGTFQSRVRRSNHWAIPDHNNTDGDTNANDGDNDHKNTDGDTNVNDGDHNNSTTDGDTNDNDGDNDHNNTDGDTNVNDIDHDHKNTEGDTNVNGGDKDHINTDGDDCRVVVLDYVTDFVLFLSKLVCTAAVSKCTRQDNNVYLSCAHQRPERSHDKY